MSAQVPSQLVDELMDMYVEWREACMALRNAYEHWSKVHPAGRRFAFAAYCVALDREELASAVYADSFSQVANELSTARPALAA